jgi:hypothetical protein
MDNYTAAPRPTATVTTRIERLAHTWVAPHVRDIDAHVNVAASGRANSPRAVHGTPLCCDESTASSGDGPSSRPERLEYELAEASSSPEFAVADAVIGLETKRSAERTIRYLSARKLRSSDFLSDDHVYRITAGGLVFPRLADVRDDNAFSAVGERVSTGIAALDE